MSARDSTAQAEQSRHLFSWIAQILGQQGLRLADLDCISLGVGPGGFTGLRIAAAAAQALALGADLPVCRVSSLATLAMGAARKHEGAAIAACTDARMGEAYLGCYRLTAGILVAEISDRLVDPSEFELPSAEQFLAVGDGWSAYPDLTARNRPRLLDVEAECWPSAPDALPLAKRMYDAGETVAPHEALPNYVRNTVTQRAE